MRSFPTLVALALSCALLSPATAADKPAAKASLYEKDVEFLLVELEKQAGHFFAIKGIDWRVVEKEFRADAKKTRTDADHLKLCARLLGRLKDGHAGFAASKVKAPDESKGRRWTGPRVHLAVVGEKVLVRTAFKESKSAGIDAGMLVSKIDNTSALEWLKRRVEVMRERGEGFSTDHQALYAACHFGLADWEGTRIAFELLDLKDKKKNVAITRRGGPNFAPFGPAFPPEPLQQLGRHSWGKTPNGFGYAHLRDIPGELPAQLDTMLDGLGDVPGLIVDLRANGGGGCDHEAVFGRFLPSGTKWRQYTGQGKRPFAGPMVVIVDAGVRSAGETVAGMLKEDGRAYLIGDSPTAGMSSQKATVAVPSGLFTVRFSVHSNKARFNGGKGIEGIGVPPHELVPYEAADLARGADSLILRAEKLLKEGFPPGVVPFAER